MAVPSQDPQTDTGRSSPPIDIATAKIEAESLDERTAPDRTIHSDSTAKAQRPRALGNARYRIVRPHARGGLGEVFLAEDDELRRLVALKEIQPQFADDPTSRNRFTFEAEVTGNLEHPGIVPVYGLGTHADGRPFYAMRFIEGSTLRDAATRFHEIFADAAQATRARRKFAAVEFRDLLGRFVDICQSVAYAHSRGVAHRDLKPSNVMLGKFGETLVVDWGLAKKLGSAIVDDTARIEVHSIPGSVAVESDAKTAADSIVGTPGYMAPEQACGDSNAAAVSGDIYSLGAILYFILIGRGPFAERQDPLAILSANASNDFKRPRLVDVWVPRPLEAICLKAMASDPNDRYGSADALASDIERWLADDAVSAHAESAWARTMRGLRRRPGLASAIAAAVLVGLLSAALGFAALGVKNRELADRNLLLADALGQASKERARAAANEQRAEAEFRKAKTAVDDFFTAVSQSQELKQKYPGMQLFRQKLMDKAKEFYDRFAQERRDDAELQDDVVIAYFNVARMLVDLGQLEKAQEHFRAIETIREKQLAANPSDRTQRLRLGLAQNHVGNTFRHMARLNEALPKLRQAETTFADLVREDGTDLRCRGELAKVRNNIGNVLMRLGRYGEANDALAAAASDLESIVPREPQMIERRRNLAMSYQQLGLNDRSRGLRKQSLEHYRKAAAVLEASPPGALDFDGRVELANCHRWVGILCDETGQPAEAKAAYLRNVNIVEKIARENPALPYPRLAFAQGNVDLGFNARQTGRWREALAHYGRALPILEQLANEDRDAIYYRDELARLHRQFADTYIVAGQSEKSLDHYRKAIALRKALFSSNSAATANRNELASIQSATAEWLQMQKRYDEALPLVMDSIALLEEATRVSSADNAARIELAFAYYIASRIERNRGKHQAAVAHARNAVDVHRQLLAMNPTEPGTMAALGQGLLGLGDCQFAVKDAAARDTYLEALAFSQAASNALPNHAEYAIQCASAQHGLARLADSTDAKAALSHYNKALEFLNPAVAKSDNSRALMVALLRGRGELLKRENRSREAEADFARANQLAPPEPK